jgi:hypothetical protein
MPMLLRLLRLSPAGRDRNKPTKDHDAAPVARPGDSN